MQVRMSLALNPVGLWLELTLSVYFKPTNKSSDPYQGTSCRNEVDYRSCGSLPRPR